MLRPCLLKCPPSDSFKSPNPACHSEPQARNPHIHPPKPMPIDNLSTPMQVGHPIWRFGVGPLPMYLSLLDSKSSM